MPSLNDPVVVFVLAAALCVVVYAMFTGGL
jgi:hypothetical protein